MQKFLLFSLLAVIVYATSSCSDGSKSQKQSVSSLSTRQDTLNRGAYLVETMGCNDCHSPKRMGAAGPELVQGKILSGYPADQPLPPLSREALKSGWLLFAHDNTVAAGPWGVSFAGNLTPDPTGIGLWPYENFKRALTQGWFKGIEGGRRLLPPMPWQNYQKLPDEDVRAIFAYLKNLPAVSNAVPAALPPQK